MLKAVMFAVVFSTTSVVSAFAQQCLHGPGEAPDQAARRREALTATRTINNIQANQPGSANKVYLRQADLNELAIRRKNARVCQPDNEADLPQSR